jgi:cytochrome d ubiquinol oxidase subunit I
VRVNDLVFARAQMGLSLAFHIIFATVGIGMPVLMAISEGLYLRTKRPVFLELAKRWAHGTAILFAVGAVSGTVLSFELGLLWPKFMEHAGAIIGMPFSLEGFAFFTEAIFLGVFLYAWNRIRPLAHWLSGIMVAISGILSGLFVVTANAWMNTPTGFDFVDGQFTNIDPIAAMLNPAALHEAIHMTFGALVATGFGAAGIHAYFLRRDPASEFHREAFRIGALLGCLCIPLQILSGDLAARRVAHWQPAKLAAMEAHYKTQANAPFIIGGIPDDTEERTHFGIEVPSALSLLVKHSASAEIPGLDQIPKSHWPPVRAVHWSFDVMVGCGTLLLVVAGWSGWLVLKKRPLRENRALLRAFILATPLGFVAIEAGWFVTEFGRQPWVIYRLLKTSDAVTPMPGLVIPFTVFTVVYLFLAAIVVFLLKRQFIATAPRSSKKNAHAP